MSYTTPQLDAAEAVAALLTGQEIAGFTIVATAEDLLPKHDQPQGDLNELRVNCVPGPESRFSRVDRNAAEEDCPVNVGIQMACGAESGELYRRLLMVLRGIAKLLTFTPITGFGYPRDDVEFVDFPSAVEVDGRFFGIVGVLYRPVTEAP